MKLTHTKKSITAMPKKWCRLEVTEQPTSHHRLVEKADGSLSYIMGAGKWQDMTPRKFRLFVRSIVQAAKAHHIEYLAVQLSNSHFEQLDEYGEEWVLRTIAENVYLAEYQFTKYKSKSKKDQTPLREICLCNGLNKTAQAGFTAGTIIAQAANITRDIANTTGADMTPRKLAAATKQALKDTSVTVKVRNEADLKKLKANLLLAVGQGTKEPTKLIEMHYQGGKKGEAPLVLVGKGITYDTGGLNVKPSGSMHDMHLDMSGGAAVIGAMQAIAKLKLKKNIIGLVAAAENAVSAEAMRAGDIFTAMNGKTVEVLHTDAEGRLALADALTYCERFKPKTVIDVATLTGASLVALGQHAHAIMTPNEELQRLLVDLGEESGDYTWPLPLWDEYQKPLKSTRADIANIASNFSRYGGTIEGGSFLKNFISKDIPWAHIDMAPRMESITSDKLAKGATGEPVRLLVTLAEAL